MQIKRYQGRNMKEALAKVKADLGPDAVIFTTKNIGSGVFGTSGVEITAAADDKAPEPKRNEKPAPRLGMYGKSNKGKKPHRALAIADEPLDNVFADTAPKTGGKHSDDTKLSDLRQDMDALRQEIRRSNDSSGSDAVRDEILRLRRLVMRMQDKNEDWLADLMTASDLSPKVAESLRQTLGPQVDQEPHQSRRLLLQRGISCIMPQPPSLPAQRIHALVGPTGVGKTTTIAKLAARARLGEGRKVLLMCLDNYRVGAVAQLSQYAELIGCELAVVHDAADFRSALASHERAELVLVDTAGRNPGDEEQVPQLQKAFAGLDVAVHLCLPVATGRREIRAIIGRYASLKPKAILSTKRDEAQSLGGMLEATLAAGVGVSFVTDGQRVPEDLHRASANTLAADICESLWETWQREQDLRIGEESGQIRGLDSVPSQGGRQWL